MQRLSVVEHWSLREIDRVWRGNFVSNSEFRRKALDLGIQSLEEALTQNRLRCWNMFWACRQNGCLDVCCFLMKLMVEGRGEVASRQLGETVWKLRLVNCLMWVQLDCRVEVHKNSSNDGWRPQMIWPSVAVSDVLSFETFLLLHNSPTYYFVVNLHYHLITFLFEQMVLCRSEKNNSSLKKR